MSGQGKIW